MIRPSCRQTGPFTYIFKSPQRSSTAVKKLFEYLKEKKLTKVAMLTASDPFGKDGSVWLDKLAPDYGITFVAKESFGPKDTDMTPQLTKIKNAKPDAIICWTIGPAGAIVAKNKAQLGITTPLFQCHGQPGPEYIQLAGKASEGDRMPSTKLMAAAQLPDSDPQKKVIQNFIQLYNDSTIWTSSSPSTPTRATPGTPSPLWPMPCAKRAPIPRPCAPPSRTPRVTWECPGSIP